MFDIFGRLLVWFYDIAHSYGWSIVLLTVAVRLVLFPLTAKQAQSMQAMQKVQPELKRLQAKYKGDRQKLNEEMMKFYKEHQINPLAGCLPLVLQLPLFFVLYRVIRGLTHTLLVSALVLGGTGVGHAVAGAKVRCDGPATGSAETTGPCRISGARVAGGTVVEGTLTGAEAVVGDRVVGKITGGTIADGEISSADVVSGATHVGKITGIQIKRGHVVGNPSYIPHDSSLYKALRRGGGKMNWLGMDLSKKPSSVHGFGTAFPFYVLIALVALSGYYQQRQMTARQPAGAANQQAQMMGRIFPVFFAFISFSIPAGVVVYFLVSNIWQIGQQALIFRQTAEPPGKPAKASEPSPPPPPTPPSSAPAVDNPNRPRQSPRRRNRRRGKGR